MAFSGSTLNKGIEETKDAIFSYGDGRIVISPSNSIRSFSVVIDDDSVKMVNSNASSGVMVGKDGVTLQGVTYFSGKGTSIQKGEFSENPNSHKIFTYKETVLIESIPKEVASQYTAKITGLNASSAMDGLMPMVTDISAGPTPHFHTISMNHVHRLEPSYLYRVPPTVQFITGAITSLKGFFAE